MLARIEDDSTARALRSLQAHIGGEVREGKLYPIASALMPCVRPEFEGAPLARRSYLLQAAPQQERKIVDALAEIGIDAYCPLEPKSVRVNMVKRRTVMRPMMPGYLFPIFDEHREHWERIPSMDGVVRLFMMNMRPVPIPEGAVTSMRDREAECIARGKASKRALVPFKIGGWVQIDDMGPWQGFLGQVTGILADRGRISIGIDVFGRQTPVEVSVNQVRAV